MDFTTIRVLSFSANATKSGQTDYLNELKPGNIGWPKRKHSVVEIIRQDYDFIGLQHVDRDKSGEFDAHGFFLSSLNRKVDSSEGGNVKTGIETYDVILQPFDRSLVRCEVNPLYYNMKKYKLLDYSVKHFKSERPAFDIGKGGHTYIAALFENLQFGFKIGIIHLRLVNKRSPNAVSYRLSCLREITDYVSKFQAEWPNVPVLLFGDTNINEYFAADDLYALGREVVVNEQVIKSPVLLQDAFLKIHGVDRHSITRAEHLYKRPEVGSSLYFDGKKVIGRGTRNPRILYTSPFADFKVLDCKFIEDSIDGGWPSYHYPLEATFRYKSAKM